jgi:succinate dehydrogenase / fumarate reductase cytochrome b subunit
MIQSTVGAKFLVALTGLALTTFVIFHMLGNLQIFLGRDAYNSYAQALQKLGPLLWVARGGLLACVVIHLGLALKLKKRNLDARPQRYVVERTKKASLPSRTMAVTGLAILAFIILHLAHFTFGLKPIATTVDAKGEPINYRDLKDPEWKDPIHPNATRHDTYRMFIEGFRNPWMVGIYIVCQLMLGAHLIHGVRSAFQTLGLSSPKFDLLLDGLTWAVTLAVVVGNIVMPLSVLFGLIGADVPGIAP